MISINNAIEAHLQRYSRIYKAHNDWTEIFCPFCDDATRKSNPSHGHLYFNLMSAYFKCFRCDEVGRLSKLLINTGFNDQEILNRLSTRTREDISYSYSIADSKRISFESVDVKRQRVLDKYSQNLDTDEFNIWYSYMIHRCLDIDFSKYFAYPEKRENQLVCSFYNFDNKYVTSRFIGNNSQRYSNSKNKVNYYFQDMLTIIRYKHIVICEGIFDLINLHNYCNRFNDAFYIAMNGRAYVETVRKLITSYLLLGEYTIHIVLDKGVINVNKTIEKIRYQTSVWNNRISIKFYEPSMSKDVSDLMLLDVRE